MRTRPARMLLLMLRIEARRLEFALVPRVRRPFLALVALVGALAVGYAVQAVNDDEPAARPSSGATSSPTSSTAPRTVSRSVPSSRGGVPLSGLPRQVAATVGL